MKPVKFFVSLIFLAIFSICINASAEAKEKVSQKEMKVSAIQKQVSSKVHKNKSGKPGFVKLDTGSIAKFKASAYYGPEKNQRKYAHGSYNADVRMNGLGKLTSSGAKPTKTTVAVDSKIISEGSVLLIRSGEMSEIRIAQDTGKAIKGRKLDLFMGHGEGGLKLAREWGSRVVDVVVLYAAKS